MNALKQIFDKKTGTSLTCRLDLSEYASRFEREPDARGDCVDLNCPHLTTMSTEEAESSLSSSRVLKIKEQFKSEEYEWTDLAKMLHAKVASNEDECEVSVHRQAPHPAIQPTPSISRATRDVDMLPSAKILVESAGDWEFSVSSVGCEFFDSREECGEFFCTEDSRDSMAPFPVYFKEQVSLEEAFEACHVQTKLKMDYYCIEDDHLFDELEQDLGRQVDRD